MERISSKDIMFSCGARAVQKRTQLKRALFQPHIPQLASLLKYLPMPVMMSPTPKPILSPH